ncbi:MAG: hypothetical protein ACRC6N_06930, partial [Plesiomonas sp.]
LYNTPDNCLSGKESPPLNQLFKHYFPLFNNSYQYAKTASNFVPLLELLKLGEMKELFISALDTKYSCHKLVDNVSEKALNLLFSDKLKISSDTQLYTLNDAHYKEIIKTYNLTSSHNTNIAKKLLTLAAIFTKYSSSTIFGTNDESPAILRYYAYALMEKAYHLDAGIFQSKMSDWKNRLLGLNNVLSCSDILSNIMISFIEEHFPDELNSLIPPAWR